MSNCVVVLITAGQLEEAEKIAHELVNQRLAACVNIVPQIISIYRWKGQVCRDGEVLLVAKTLRQRYAELERAVKQWHSYEVPEVIALPIEDGSDSYLDWVAESVTETETNH
jgi:periplasmic divalent cation tolerance protein